MFLMTLIKEQLQHIVTLYCHKITIIIIIKVKTIFGKLNMHKEHGFIFSFLNYYYYYYYYHISGTGLTTQLKFKLQL